jgi:hypothetical protein
MYYNSKPKSAPKGGHHSVLSPKKTSYWSWWCHVGKMLICKWLDTCKNGVSYMQPWLKLTWLSIVEMINKKCKLLQFAYILHLLSEGHLMKVDYEGMKSLFKKLWINNYPHKHWSNSLGWIMGEHMHNVMLDTMQWPMAKVNFLSISCEEITNIDNQTWASVHVYVVQEWCKVPI